MLIPKLQIMRIPVCLLILISMSLSQNVFSDSFNAYPGKYKATLSEVEAANIIHLSVEVWTGYPKQFRITLADIAVPVASSETPLCQNVLVQTGFELTRDFMDSAKQIEVNDIHMENTGKVDAISGIKTEKGQLANALLKRGLARSIKVNAEVPWCVDEIKDAKTSKSNVNNAQKTTTGFMQEITEVRVHKGANRSGKEVYEYRCQGCHEKNTQGAPMPTDNFAWTQRLNKGMDVLMDHAMKGYSNYLMPPKGGCRDCNEAEIHASVIFMLESSGIELTQEQRLLVSKK